MEEQLSGVLSCEAFGGTPTWTLTPDDGQPVQLRGEIDPALEGQRVHAKVRAAEAGFGFAMVGPVYDALEVRPA